MHFIMTIAYAPTHPGVLFTHSGVLDLALIATRADYYEEALEATMLALERSKKFAPLRGVAVTFFQLEPNSVR